MIELSLLMVISAVVTLMCSKLGTAKGSIVATVPWIAGILGDLGNKGTIWTGNQAATERLEIVSFMISFGCVTGVLIDKRLRRRLMLSMQELRHVLIWSFLAFYIISFVWSLPCGLLFPGAGMMSLLAYAMIGSVLSYSDIQKSLQSVLISSFVLLALSLFYNGVLIPGIPIEQTVKYDNIFYLKDFFYSRRIGLIPSVVTDGAIIGLCLACAQLFTGKSNQMRRKFAWLSLIIVLLHIITIQARWIIVVCVGLLAIGGMIILFNFKEYRVRKKILALVAIAVSFLILIEILTNTNYLSRGAFYEDAGRRELYLKSWNLLIRGPLFGYGYGSSTIILERENGLVDSLGRTLGVHNAYLLIGLETGIAGMIVWSCLLAWTIIYWMRRMIRCNIILPDELTYQYFIFIMGFLTMAYVLGGTFHSLINVPWLWYMILFNNEKKRPMIIKVSAEQKLKIV